MNTTTLQQVLDAKVKLTPMMKQYTSLKEKYGDHLLLFRMGDFYEVFFEDAVRASKLLNITLTHRGKVGDFPIPMAGIPHHAATAYVDRLSGYGIKVAICEQVQDPKEAKGIVKRAVTQVVSPSMPFDLDKADSYEHHFMGSSFYREGRYYLVLLDFTTGEFLGHIFDNQEDFIKKLELYSPREMVTFMGQWEREGLQEIESEGRCEKAPQGGALGDVGECFDRLQVLKTHLSQEYFDPKYTGIYIEKLIPSYKRDQVVKAHQRMLSPIGALAYYVTSTQSFDKLSHIHPFRIVNEEGVMKVSLRTLQGLEILPKGRGSYRESLLGHMDKTQTAMGSRNLKKMFISPLYNLKEIKKRQGGIAHLLENQEKLVLTRQELSEVRDIERILAKVSTHKVNAGDLLNIAIAVKTFISQRKLYEESIIREVLSLNLFGDEFKKLILLQENIEKTINAEIGASLEKGNLIQEGCHEKRDRLAKLSLHAEDELAKLEERYREETGISKLRIKFNNVAGHFIEVSKSFTKRVPEYFQRRQTLVNSERYTTVELREFEKERLHAHENLERIERQIFKDLVREVSLLSPLLQDLAHSLALIDSLQSLAWVALQDDFSRPCFLEGSHPEVRIQQAWHPLIKESLKDQFVCHDLNLTRNCFFGLITGPNMAGKTTVMREVAIIQILAQIGSYVPAKGAELGLCDFLFSRLGASDDILKGQSTFMVEMAETAEIIRHATNKSLVILDEVGRGTSTYDGLSIAWALCEHLIHKTQCLTLFATHYHELIEVIDGFSQAKNLTVEIESKKGHVQFLYRLVEKGATQSFGIYVAKLAGLPSSLLLRAEDLLKSLEKEQRDLKKEEEFQDIKGGPQLSLFPEMLEKEQAIPQYLKDLEREFKSMDLNKRTPLQIMNKVYALKEKFLS